MTQLIPSITNRYDYDKANRFCERWFSVRWEYYNVITGKIYFRHLSKI